MRAKEFIGEAGYIGNVGIQEMARFFMMATDEQKKKFKELTKAGLQKMAWKLVQDVTGMKLVGDEFTESKSITEGGWANAKTQDTVITPTTIANAVKVLAQFNAMLNKMCYNKGLPEVTIGHPVGSGTYYERDLKVNPTKEYGDIDVQFILPRIESMNNNQNQQVYFDLVAELCAQNPNFETENGKNVIFQIGKDYIQVDLVAMFTDTAEFSKAMAPEWNTKGVLSASIYSALAEVLHLSIGSFGVQAKTINGQVVKYATQKGTTLHTVSLDHNNWGIDIVKFLGCTRVSPLLQDNPGMKDEVRVKDIITTIKGICETLELNGKGAASALLNAMKESYISKINKVITSSKFDKAASPAAVEKAEHTKHMLADKSAKIAALF